MKIKLVFWMTLILLPGSVYAGSIYNVTFNTTPLIGDPAGPFSIALEMADGSASGDGNNAALLSTFDFGTGGGPVGSPLLLGSAFGDLSSTVVLTDASPNSIFVQTFTPGDALSFQLSLTGNVDPGGIVDEFIFSILDQSFNTIPSRAGFPLNQFIEVDFDSFTPTVTPFAGDDTIPTNAGGSPIALDAPVLTSAATPVPEPATLSLLALGLVFGPIRRFARHRLPTGISNRR